MSTLDSALRSSRRQLVWLTLVMGLVIGGMSIVFVRQFVREPVARLQEGIERIGRGDLDTRLPIVREDEVGRLASAINGMAAEIKDSRAALTGWSEKLTREVEQKTLELQRIQRQVVHMEKMASLGKLSATVAHEINNPLAGILNYAKLVARELRQDEIPPEEREELQRYLLLIQKESARCGDIVRNLLLFAKQSGRDFAASNLNALVDRSLLLLRHHMEMARVRLENFPVKGDDGLLCDADQIQQAVVALLMNAVEAMTGQGGGLLTVRGEARPEVIVLSIADSGGGIPPEVLPHVFEPFFTTKNKESGAGLGLAVVFGIIQRHGGEIEIDTQLGEGTTFRVTLHRRPSVPHDGPPDTGSRNEAA
jgi:two-component system, NtrC family, sensor kinase